MGDIKIKTKEEVDIMRQGGQKLARVKKGLKKAVKEGVRASEIEKRAIQLIEAEGAEASFKRVEDYSWATCVNVNEGVVHGIPHEHIIFSDGDLVSVDVGLFYKGFHTDTSFTVLIGKNKELEKMLEIGRSTLKKAISQARPGKHISDISRAMEDGLNKNGLNPIKSLVGHGVGRDLHEEPMIPCFVSGSTKDDVKIKTGMVLAIEIMYTMGQPGIKIDQDGWTIITKDGKISALFEETVAVTSQGPFVLT